MYKLIFQKASSFTLHGASISRINHTLFYEASILQNEILFKNLSCWDSISELFVIQLHMGQSVTLFIDCPPFKLPKFVSSLDFQFFRRALHCAAKLSARYDQIALISPPRAVTRSFLLFLANIATNLAKNLHVVQLSLIHIKHCLHLKGFKLLVLQSTQIAA